MTPSSDAFSSAQPPVSLWKKAFEKISEEEQKQLPSPPAPDREDYLEILLSAAKTCREACRKSHSKKFTFVGKNIIIGDVADKLLAWIDKFKTIGDVIVQYDPGHAAIPWAAVRFLLQVSLSLQACGPLLMRI